MVDNFNVGVMGKDKDAWWDVEAAITRLVGQMHYQPNPFSELTPCLISLVQRERGMWVVLWGCKGGILKCFFGVPVDI